MKRLVPLALLALVVTGCSSIAPKYNTDFSNIAQLRRENVKAAKVASVTKDPAATADVDHLTIRGGSYLSPNGSYTAYLEEALKQELDDARLFDPASQIEVSAVLLRNTLDAAGMSTGIAEMEARFFVRNAGVVKYDKVKAAKHTWESSFAGAVAIPRAQQNYPVVVRKLLGLLFNDPDFISALK